MLNILTIKCIGLYTVCSLGRGFRKYNMEPFDPRQKGKNKKERKEMKSYQRRTRKVMHMLIAIVIGICSIMLMTPAIKAEAATDSHVFVVDRANPSKPQRASCNGKIKNGGTDKCKITLKISGKLIFKVTNTTKPSDIENSMYVGLYDAKGDEVTAFYVEDGTGRTSSACYLRAGTYTLEVSVSEFAVVTKSYKVEYKFVSSNETFIESSTKNDDIPSYAHTITPYGQVIRGQYGYKDSYDYYKFRMPVSGKVTFAYVSNKTYAAYELLDSNKNRITDSFIDDDTTSLEDTFDLKAGVYYLKCDYGFLTGENHGVDDWGFYKFSLKLNAKLTGSIDVTYKGKTATVCKVSNIYDKTGSKSNTIRYASLKKKWGAGRADKVTSTYGKHTYVTGKSALQVVEVRSGSKVTKVTLVIRMRDKNMAVNGVKYGMTKADAVRMLQRKYGNTAVRCSGNSIKVLFGPFNPMEYKLTSGKVSEFYFRR